MTRVGGTDADGWLVMVMAATQMNWYGKWMGDGRIYLHLLALPERPFRV